MQARINVNEKSPNAVKALFQLGGYMYKSSFDQHLLMLVYFRVSQVNRCAVCLDMHSKELRAAGETEQRLYMMDAWRESPMYTDRERAAFAWAEGVTQLSVENVPDHLYATVREQFSEEEVIELTMGIITINAYNRLNIAFRMTAGNYQTGGSAA
ncbi:MAG TPA: carboxymuconolactone decarboxylase family protein [Chitinophaga sp.]|uniref:carboxymuconolactone decarboxylase family protein n=1 Tax=Chitinophaga sp. TaxID=1869181 RepID=UPI002C59B158|nr:carboxymuconolactone decarboxylase family protein [Chitinophaga sp.]HVI46374.1 carboxymuconolactone decarboxylase family protein [Chitinophaga sp.]